MLLLLYAVLPAFGTALIYALAAAGIAPQRRAETLTLAEWGDLTKIVERNR